MSAPPQPTKLRLVRGEIARRAQDAVRGRSRDRITNPLVGFTTEELRAELYRRERIERDDYGVERLYCHDCRCSYFEPKVGTRCLLGKTGLRFRAPTMMDHPDDFGWYRPRCRPRLAPSRPWKLVCPVVRAATPMLANLCGNCHGFGLEPSYRGVDDRPHCEVCFGLGRPARTTL